MTGIHTWKPNGRQGIHVSAVRLNVYTNPCGLILTKWNETPWRRKHTSVSAFHTRASCGQAFGLRIHQISRMVQNSGLITSDLIIQT